jgi:hypothetical protein
MSSETLWWLKNNGAAAYADIVGNRHVGRHLIIRVLEDCALHAQAGTGDCWVSDRVQENLLGESRRDIRNARDQLATLGYLVDINTMRGRAKVWRVVIPGYSFADEIEPQKPAKNGRANGRANGRGVGRDIPPLTEQNRTPPQTPQGETYTQVIALVIAKERNTTRGEPGGGLLRKWEQDYTPIVSQALHDHPDLTPEAIATLCYKQRNGHTPERPTPATPQRPTPRPDCPDCGGAGNYRQWNDTEQDYGKTQW